MATKQNKDSQYTHTRTTKRTTRLVWTFSVLTLLFTGFIIYTTTIKTDIIFTRATYPVQVTFALTVDDTPGEDEISGSLESQTVEYRETEVLIGTTSEITGFAEGIITVTNNWSQAQPLQATTRFLSPEGVLFRSTERVDVPAGGTADVPVRADQEGAQGDIPAGTQFTIPGLWVGLQEQIYGTNERALTGGTRTVSVATQNQIDAVEEKALAGLDARARQELGATESNRETFILRTELLSNQSSVSAGDSAESISVTVRGRYVKLMVNSDIFYKTLYDKLQLILTEDEEILSIPLDQLELSIERISLSDNRVTVRVKASAETRLKDSASLFSTISLQGKTPEEISSLVQDEKGIEKVDVRLEPFWATKTPMTASHVNIHIN